MSARLPVAAPCGAGFDVTASRHFLDWLEGTGASLAVTTYHSNRLFLFGVERTGDRPRLCVFQPVFERAMGLAARPDRLLLATRYQLWQLDDVPRPRASEPGYDRLYRPHLAWTTGELDIHDIAFGRDGEPIFVNTLYGCLATVHARHGFRPLWKPPFLSRLAPEDRCHLNGLAMDDGLPRFVTAVAATDVAAGWRERRQDGGVVVDVASGEIVASGLSMPHSPRLHHGRLWVLNSGTGDLGAIDLGSGRFEPLCFCPGYLRGLAFHDGYAIVGLSRCRELRTFSGLALDDRLRDEGAEARAGLAVVELASGAVVHWLELSGELREMYDVQVLPGVRCPAVDGLRGEPLVAVPRETEASRVARQAARGAHGPAGFGGRPGAGSDGTLAP